MHTTHTVRTRALDIAYRQWNPHGERSIILLHGWPDSPASWTHVAPILAQAGWRVLAPALRGFAPTRYLPDTPRSGQLSALGRDLLEYMDALQLTRPVLVGHDWGARAAGNACGLRENAASHLIMISVGYGTNSPDHPLNLTQARNYWYHWYMATERGATALRQEPENFARMMWDTWSPPGWYSEADFAEAAQAFQGADYADTVIHSYRHRWGYTEGDPAYVADEATLNPAPQLHIPTLILHGSADTCNHPDTSANRAHHFTNRYERQLIDNVGHFPQREAPQAVAQAILTFCA